MRRGWVFKRLLVYIVVGVALLSACAKPPAAELDEARRMVAFAYASGASQLAADLYLSASDALRSAEEQVRRGDYRAAELSLQQAIDYSDQALLLVGQRKQQIELLLHCK